MNTSLAAGIAAKAGPQKRFRSAAAITGGGDSRGNTTGVQAAQ